MPSAEWKQFVYLYHCGVNGLRPEPPAQRPDPEALLQLADRQAATGVIGAALRSCGSEWLPQDAALRLRLDAASKNLHNRQRMEAVLSVIGQLQRQGFRVTVLKGMALAALYRWPECRSSSDTDLLIAPKQERAVLAALRRLGFEPEPRKPGAPQSHHSACTHPEAGLFEVHTAFFPPEYRLPLLWDEKAAAAGPRTTQRLWDYEFEVPAPDEHLRYLFRHLLKHFTHEWTSFRVFYDVALFFTRHREELDAAAFWRELSELGAADFFNVFLSLLVRAGCFREEDFPGMCLQPEDICEQLETDIASFDRDVPDAFEQNYPVWLSYLKERSGQLDCSFEELLEENVRQRRRETLFPPAELLARRYPSLLKHRWLYPVYWLRRGWSGLFDPERRASLRRLSVSDIKRELAAQAQPEAGRVTLFSELELLQKNDR